MRECASAVAVHRNATNNGLVLTSGHETASSSTDVFGFGYGRGDITLIVRYDTRLRVVASYGCSVKLGYEEIHLTGGQFWHGGGRLSVMPDCGPGSWVDLIAEDWRLLSSGKKRLKFDPSCGTIPVCDEPSLPPSPMPSPPPATPAPSPQPSPPPFPPGTIRPPTPPHAPAKASSPKSPHPEDGSHGDIDEESAILAISAATAVSAFGILGCCLFCFGARSSRRRIERKRPAAPPLIAVGMIAPDGSSRVVTGRKVVLASERQSLLYG